MKPQRYYINELPNGGVQILADDSGEWVKWEDVKPMTARPSWPPSDDWIEAVLECEGLTVVDLEGAKNQNAVDHVKRLLSHFTPPAPEVASEEARSLVEELIGVVEGLADQQAMQDDFYREPLSRAKATLAKWGAARKEEKP